MRVSNAASKCWNWPKLGVREVVEAKLISEPAQHAELVGGKYHWLTEHETSKTHWDRINTKPDFYAF